MAVTDPRPAAARESAYQPPPLEGRNLFADDAISVRVAGVKKFNAVPVASRGQIAIEIRGRHED